MKHPAVILPIVLLASRAAVILALRELRTPRAAAVAMMQTALFVKSKAPAKPFLTYVFS